MLGSGDRNRIKHYLYPPGIHTALEAVRQRHTTHAHCTRTGIHTQHRTPPANRFLKIQNLFKKERSIA